MEADEAGGAERRRRRVQHDADPYPVEGLPEVAHADFPKAYDQAVDVPVGYPPLRPVHAEQFRRRPVAVGHAADSPGYGPPGQAVPVPTSAPTPGMISRPLLTDGRSRPCAPEA
jgi:hypothetical protein